MDYDFIGKTILIVEDEAVCRLLFEKALKKTRATLLFVKDGVEAVKTIKESDEIDLVLMDVRLPRMNGFEAVAKIKEHNPELPVVIQTAYALDSTKEEAHQLGCDDFITKPIIIESLMNILKKHLLYWND